MPKRTWEVTINVDGDHVLTIGSNHLAGVENIDGYADTILTCAQHLVSFTGGETEREMVFREEGDRTARNRDMWKGQCERQAERLTAFHALLREALAALEPLAEAAASYDPPEDDDHLVAWNHDFTLGSIRRARTLSDKIRSNIDEVQS